MKQIDELKKINDDLTENDLIGKIFFVNICALSSINITDEYYDCDTITCGGENTTSYLKKNYFDEKNMLIAIKYLGNNIFEEMTTGEKIRIGDIYFDSGELTIEPIVLELNYEDYFKMHKKTLSKYEYVQKLQSLMDANIETPLVLNGSYDFDLLKVNEESKKLYLSHSDEERKLTINEIKKIALSDSEVVNERINISVESLKNIDTEDIELAYLDNQLYDFEQKGRTK